MCVYMRKYVYMYMCLCLCVSLSLYKYGTYLHECVCVCVYSKISNKFHGDVSKQGPLAPMSFLSLMLVFQCFVLKTNY